MSANDSQTSLPQGELALRTIAMPADTSEKDYIFGGWMLNQMDLAASRHAWLRAGRKVSTVAANDIRFRMPMLVGDEVSTYARILEVKHTSMIVGVEMWIRAPRFANPTLAVTGTFVFVSIDETTGKPAPIDRPPSTPP
jgi:acyl-CoA thioesterase YciA